MAIVLLITTKLNVIFRSECGNLALTGKKVKSDDDVSIKEHLSSSITRLILKLMLNNNVAIKENLFFCNYMSAFEKLFNSHYQQQRF